MKIRWICPGASDETTVQQQKAKTKIIVENRDGRYIDNRYSFTDI